MATYRYLAGKTAKTAKEVYIEADNQHDSLTKLRRMGLTPVRFLGEGSAEMGTSGVSKSKVDIYAFSRELAVLLRSHVPLEKGLALVAESASTPEQQEFVASFRRGLHEGKSFSSLIRQHGRLFPPFYANLIETGEETGCLPDVMREINKFMEESKSLKDFIISSSIYPAVILLVSIGMLAALFIYFVPKFSGVFLQMGREVPSAMQFLIIMSDVCKYALIIIPTVLIGGYFGLRAYLGRTRLRYYQSLLLLKLPIFGKLTVDLEMCRFLRTLGILVGNHVEIIRTVVIASRVISHEPIYQSLVDLSGKLKSGLKLSAALAGNQYMPNGAVAMMRMGEESGEVGEMLASVADRLDEDTRRSIKRLLSLFEPVVIIVLASIILVVVVAIFVSVLEMNSIK